QLYINLCQGHSGRQMEPEFELMSAHPGGPSHPGGPLLLVHKADLSPEGCALR
ncbi:Hypothetical predicted protein, partial [Xyrichtys novacula]